jgi:hypothetical protein
MLDYEGSSTELVGSSGAELRHNPLSFQLLRARARARERNIQPAGAKLLDRHSLRFLVRVRLRFSGRVRARISVPPQHYRNA